MKRGLPKVSKQFALNLNEVKTKVGTLEFEVTEKSIYITTKIPVQG